MATSPPEMQVRSFVGEGFGVVGGVVGTWLGAELIGVAIVSALCIGPFGAFVVILVCASLTGVAMAQGGKLFGDKIYDVGSRLGGRVFHSMDDLVGAINE